MTWLEFQVTLAIKLSLQVYAEPSYVAWANKWLDGSDRTAATADAAAYYAAYAAAAYADAADASAAAIATSSIRYSIRAGAKLESVVKFL